MMPLQRPDPALPTSRPLPLAWDAPTWMLTDTTPARLMPPVTLPPPADETRVPATANGTLLVELQLPAWVAKITFQVPSYAPGRTVAASAAPGMAKAATTATAEIHRKARLEAKSVEWAIDR